MTRALHWAHQQICGGIFQKLNTWSRSSGLGRVDINPNIIFSDVDNVIPDVVLGSNERLAVLLDDAGHLTGAPELVIEMLSLGEENQRRDREVKLKLYSLRGVQKYWVVDWRLPQVEVYRRERATLVLIATLFTNDELSSPLLPGFMCPVARLFS